jgi:alpha-maltose-1-phosphate synthase
MGTTAAILYKRDGYDTQRQRLLGRQAAGAGFLKGLVQYGTADSLFCYASTQPEFADFCQLIAEWYSPQPRRVQWIPEHQPTAIAQAGTLYRPDSILAPLAWQRRFNNQRAYSLCGVTHTIASKAVMQGIGDLLLGPLQPWDALICTSEAVKHAVIQILDDWADYLGDRTGTKLIPQLQLPVIPLGVDCQTFPVGEVAAEMRQQLRQELCIAADEIVVLFVGRLVFYAKAHPVPMYQALEQAAQATETKLHLIQAGWFESPEEAQHFQAAAKTFCPSVNTIFLDGRKLEVRDRVWSAADIFISLADNIQETFGLTPIEAMAAGLPVIVSDWNGYHETVRDGQDGFRIPTTIPPIGTGLELAAQLCTDSVNYSTYVGQTAIATSVDITACAQALIALINSLDLRQQYGANGRQRAQRVYDWSVIIAGYESLWHNLATLRNTEQMMVPLRAGMPPYPLCDDPFRSFAHYATITLTSDTSLMLRPGLRSDDFSNLQANKMSHFGASKRLSEQAIQSLLQFVSKPEGQTVAAILAFFRNQSATAVMMTLGYLLKFQILQIKSLPKEYSSSDQAS